MELKKDVPEFMREAADWWSPTNQDRRAMNAAAEGVAALIEFAENFRKWHAKHFEDFDSETSSQLLSLANDAEASLSVCAEAAAQGGRWRLDWFTQRSDDK